MNKALLSDLTAFLHSHKSSLLDIILFGSIVRGKDAPQDIDLIVLFKEQEIQDITYALQKLVEKHNAHADILPKTYATLLEDAFLGKEAVLKEGYSILYGTFLARQAGFNTMILFRYDLNKLTNSQRIRFYYSIYGRQRSGGMQERLGLVKFSDNLLLSPIERQAETEAYLQEQGIPFEQIPLLIPDRGIAFAPSRPQKKSPAKAKD
jgi:predicted nucleotidyltransferase